MPPSSQNFFSILDHSPIGHFILDRELAVRYWNRCLEDWTGITRREIVGQNILERFPHLDDPKYRNRIEQVFSGGPPATFSSQLHKHFLPAPLPGGKKRIQQTVVTPLTIIDAGSDLALFSIQDVTSLTEAVNNHTKALQQLTIEIEERKQEVERRKAAEESLREMDRMKNDFISSAAHELNNPLATLLNYVQLFKMSKGDLPEEKREAYLDKIIGNINNLSRIVNDLLDISRFEQGRGIVLTRENRSPEKLIHELIDHLEPLIKTHNFELQLDEASTNQTAFDPLRIRQVLENVINNAIKYSPTGTTITIASDWNDQGVTISVIDQGVGMNEKQLARVFDKFYRVDSSAAAVSGLGLGMNIVKQIVDQHDGHIEINSTPDAGTTVSIFLPFAKAQYII
ncbi:MAG: hypothetical protein C0615_09450 [Desulfuromonas sp.]|nr:MAG: hypothetical protein C0615_09450 [Desulfuromonas sp.]